MAARHPAEARRALADERTRTDKLAALGYSAEGAVSTLNVFLTMITTRQLKAAMVMLGWQVADLAMASSVSQPAIWRLETEDGPLAAGPETVAKLTQLEQFGGDFSNFARGGASQIKGLYGSRGRFRHVVTTLGISFCCQ